MMRPLVVVDSSLIIALILSYLFPFYQIVFNIFYFFSNAVFFYYFVRPIDQQMDASYREAF